MFNKKRPWEFKAGKASRIHANSRGGVRFDPVQSTIASVVTWHFAKTKSTEAWGSSDRKSPSLASLLCKKVAKTFEGIEELGMFSNLKNLNYDVLKPSGSLNGDHMGKAIQSGFNKAKLFPTIFFESKKEMDKAALNQYREDSQKARSCGGGGNNAETNTPHSSRGRQHQSSLTTLTLVEASKNHPAAASELNKLKKKGAGDILTQGVAEEASKYTISILSSVDNPLAQSVITADYKDFTLASIFDVNLSGCLFEMGVKGSRNEVSSRVFKVIGVAHAMLKVQQPTRFFLGLGNRDKKVSEHNLIAVDLGSPQDLRNKLQNATVIRQAMFKGELKESKALSYQRMPVIRELDNKSFETGHYRKFAWQTETDLNSINRWLKDRGEEGHPTFWNPPEFVTLNYVNWPTGC